MNRIDKLFAHKKKNVLAVYFTAGFPSGENVSITVRAIAEAGVDLVEVGMPFSDPLADGPVIQESSSAALKNGMNIFRLFEQLKPVRSMTDVPIVLMGYLNPVMQFGVERFLSECNACGIDGVILPDLPVEVYTEQYKSLFSKYSVHPIFLVSPSTPAARVQLIAEESRGFIYVVSSSSTTGTQSQISQIQKNQLETVLRSITTIPSMVGFGIHDRISFDAATQYADGGVIGTAFIRELMVTGNSAAAIQSLLKKVKPELYDHSIV